MNDHTKVKTRRPAFWPLKSPSTKANNSSQSLGETTRDISFGLDSGDSSPTLEAASGLEASVAPGLGIGASMGFLVWPWVSPLFLEWWLESLGMNCVWG